MAETDTVPMGAYDDSCEEINRLTAALREAEAQRAHWMRRTGDAQRELTLRTGAFMTWMSSNVHTERGMNPWAELEKAEARAEQAEWERAALRDCGVEFGACMPPCAKHAEEVWKRWHELIDTTGRIVQKDNAIIEAERGRAEAAEQEIEEHRQHAQDKHRRAESLAAALRPFSEAFAASAKRTDWPDDQPLLSGSGMPLTRGDATRAVRVLAGEPRQDGLREWARKLMIARHRWHVKDGRWYPLDDDEWGELARLSGVLDMSDAELNEAAGVAEPEREGAESQ